MRIMKMAGVLLASTVCALVHPHAGTAATAEWNPIRTHDVAIGPQTGRLVVGFKAGAGPTITQRIKSAARLPGIAFTQARTSAADAAGVAHRAGLALTTTRQLTPSMHVLFLQKTLFGADVERALANLRADPAVEFAEVDHRRYPHALPNDPLFGANSGSVGQWYMQTPDPAGDAAATDAVSAWNITTGSAGTIIADVDTGVRFDHPDLLRAGFGGRLLPGYDFVGGDLDVNTSVDLGTFLIANDGDGWDSDPSDPGDWINSTDQMNSGVFPASKCKVEDSSWHGTRVVGVLGAVSSNDTGIAGMTWQPYILPVRALGKCGGYDSDIIAGIEWAAGLSVAGVPDNPFPADIINLSLGGSSGESCPASYQSVVTTLSAMGVLIVVSAGNESGPVDVPANCKGVLGVVGLRNVGTKVGYSSLGPEAGIAAPAGNCVNSSGACLRSIDTTYNTGLTVPGSNSYTNQTAINIGTSFSAPIVSGVAALMRAVNGNLTPAQLIARMQASATAFPQPSGLAQCSAASSDGSGECACTTGTCGAGMVNALSAVTAALKPIAAVAKPAGYAGGSGLFNGGGSAAACGASIVSYAWTRSGGVQILSGATTPQVSITANGTAGTLTLTVTDSANNTDTATLNFSATGVTGSAPAGTGGAAGACPTPWVVAPVAPTVNEVFAPAGITTGTESTLTLTLVNANAFALTQANLSQSLPANLSVSSSTAPSTTCRGASAAAGGSGSTVSLSNAEIPAAASCTLTVAVKAAVNGRYSVALDAQALTTGPAGGNAAASAPAVLDVTAPATSAGSSAGGGGGGGGGEIDWFDVLFVVGVLLAGRRGARGRQPIDSAAAYR